MCLDLAGRLTIELITARALMVRLSLDSSFSICLLLGSAMVWKASSVGGVSCFPADHKCIDLLYVPAANRRPIAGVDGGVCHLFKPGMFEAKGSVSVVSFHQCPDHDGVQGNPLPSPGPPFQE